MNLYIPFQKKEQNVKKFVQMCVLRENAICFWEKVYFWSICVDAGKKEDLPRFRRLAADA